MEGAQQEQRREKQTVVGQWANFLLCLCHLSPFLLPCWLAASRIPLLPPTICAHGLSLAERVFNATHPPPLDCQHCRIQPAFNTCSYFTICSSVPLGISLVMHGLSVLPSHMAWHT